MPVSGMRAYHQPVECASLCLVGSVDWESSFVTDSCRCLIPLLLRQLLLVSLPSGPYSGVTCLG